MQVLMNCWYLPIWRDNAMLISKGIEQKERMIELRALARLQLASLEKLNSKSLVNVKESAEKNV